MRAGPLRRSGPGGRVREGAGSETRRFAGWRDLERAAAALAERLPTTLGVFARLAFNYRWAWSLEGRELFRAIDAHRWQVCGENPVRLLQEAPAASLARAASNGELVERAEALERALHEELARPFEGPLAAERPVAFLCAECAVHASLPIYAGGLGALAGDVLKEASDRALPFVAVSLLYRQGYFRQRLDGSGWQHESWLDTDPERLPAALVTDAAGEPITIRIPLDAHHVVAQIWRVDVGRVPLYLLDTERPENARVDRWIGARLYVGDRETRLAQYALLGVGGVRALRALGIDPGVVHLNEGHAAFASLELAREEVARGRPFDAALAAARARVVFTTHTPVAAGNEEYTAREMLETIEGYVKQLGLDPEAVLALGRRHPEDRSEGFGLTQLALRTSRFANGVSRLHGRVARSMWRELWPGRAADEVPIDHVTNGVHLPTWMAPSVRRLLARHLGRDFERRADDPSVWARVEEIPDEEIWALRRELRGALVRYVQDKSVADRLARGGTTRHYAEAAAIGFDPNVLTLGFARRLAAYKRLHLLSHHTERALRLLDGAHPVQIVVAGKAHPEDREAKGLVRRLFPITERSVVALRVAFLEDYDLSMAAHLVSGCDVWINLPRPPLEASGTSGMKAALNGALHLSVLDGWWDEAYEPGVGWAISGQPEAPPDVQDDADATALYELLEREVIPLFYERDASGVPRAFVRRIKRSLRAIGPRFNAGRMVAEYVERAYRGA